MPLTSPRLWVVATPLGNIDDLSSRAREILASADLILAEDTRRAAMLLRQCGIKPKKMLSFFDHNEERRREEILTRLREGENIAIVSDAGTPLLADPGYRLVRSCRANGLPVSPVPGPSAPVAALSAAGIPPLPFSFLGFLPRSESGKARLFSIFAHAGTIVFFERKDRLADSLATAFAVLGPREFAICRELTKTYEEFILGRLENPDLASRELPGEMTIIIGPQETSEKMPREEALSLLRAELDKGKKAKEAARLLKNQCAGWTASELYALANETRGSHSA